MIIFVGLCGNPLFSYVVGCEGSDVGIILFF